MTLAQSIPHATVKRPNVLHEVDEAVYRGGARVDQPDALADVLEALATPDLERLLAAQDQLSPLRLDDEARSVQRYSTHKTVTTCRGCAWDEWWHVHSHGLGLRE